MVIHTVRKYLYRWPQVVKLSLSLSLSLSLWPCIRRTNNKQVSSRSRKGAVNQKPPAGRARAAVALAQTERESPLALPPPHPSSSAANQRVLMNWKASTQPARNQTPTQKEWQKRWRRRQVNRTNAALSPFSWRPGFELWTDETCLTPIRTLLNG